MIEEQLLTGATEISALLLAPARVLRWLAAVVACPWFFTVGMELQLEELGVYAPSNCAVMWSSREGAQLALSESCLAKCSVPR